jgi:hypothetical protein
MRMLVNVTKTDPNGKDPLIGQQVGASYVIAEQIGSGGMGTVYSAESAALGGLCASEHELHSGYPRRLLACVHDANMSGGRDRQRLQRA